MVFDREIDIVDNRSQDIDMGLLPITDLGPVGEIDTQFVRLCSDPACSHDVSRIDSDEETVTNYYTLFHITLGIGLVWITVSGFMMFLNTRARKKRLKGGKDSS